jgi:hypothetical protein
MYVPTKGNVRFGYNAQTLNFVQTNVETQADIWFFFVLLNTDLHSYCNYIY